MLSPVAFAKQGMAKKKISKRHNWPKGHTLKLPKNKSCITCIFHTNTVFLYLQVYKMVGGIDECRDAVVEGLKRRLQAIEDRDQPLQNMVKSLRETLDKAQVLKNVRDQHEHRIDQILDTRRQVLDFVTRFV